ncbi:glycosyltransferase family 2 protein [Brucellaceae bacterium C25G]
MSRIRSLALRSPLIIRRLVVRIVPKSIIERLIGQSATLDELYNAKEKIFSKDQALLAAAENEALQYNWLKSIEIAQKIAPSSHSLAALMKYYVSLRDFSNAIDIYEKRDSKIPSTRIMMQYYLTSLANIQEKTKIRKIISEEMTQQNSGTFIPFLVYRYAKTYDPQLTGALRKKIHATPNYTKTNFFNIIMLSHDSFNEKEWELAYSFLAASTPKNHVERNTVHFLRSQIAYITGDYELQMAKVNEILISYKQDRISLIDNSIPMCPGNLKLTVPEKSYSHPLVSVLITTYNSVDTINYAVTSILSQTYANIELIIVDDCSTDNTFKHLKDIAAKDSRVKLFCTPKNNGTYCAKNIGLHNATGEFVVCHDSDDWAHPQKLKFLVDYLLANPAYIAVQPMHTRSSSNVGVQNRGGHYIRRDASSLMYRRQPVMEKMGYYDSVRAGADGEFQFRMERCFKRENVAEIPQLLNFVLKSEQSLSGGGRFTIDENTGAFTQVRNAYRRAFSLWHQQTSDFYLPLEQQIRKFNVPQDMMP